jgi:pimeloyl-ACP methyl ester carboxylesterase
LPTTLLLSAAVLLAIGIYAAFAHDLSRARSRLAGRTQTIPTASGTLEYAVTGSGDPVLVIHGAEGGFDQALDMTGPLVQRGFQLIAPSRFGYLGSTSSGAQVTPAIQADAYAELLDRLSMSEVSVAAVSAGAWSALQFAIRHPKRCRALVLIVPANYLPPNVRIQGGRVIQAMVESDFAAWAAVKILSMLPPGVMAERMLGTPASVVRAADSGEKARIANTLDHFLPVSERRKGMQIDVWTAADRRPYPLEKISCPVLTISAEDDQFGTALRARQIATAVLNGRAVIYPSGGHALVGHYRNALDDSAAFLSAVRRQEARP